MKTDTQYFEEILSKLDKLNKNYEQMIKMVQKPSERPNFKSNQLIKEDNTETTNH